MKPTNLPRLARAHAAHCVRMTIAGHAHAGLASLLESGWGEPADDVLARVPAAQHLEFRALYATAFRAEVEAQLAALARAA